MVSISKRVHDVLSLSNTSLLTDAKQRNGGFRRKCGRGYVLWLLMLSAALTLAIMTYEDFRIRKVVFQIKW